MGSNSEVLVVCLMFEMSQKCQVANFYSSGLLAAK